MILYTCMPHEVVFHDETNDAFSQQKTVEIDGGLLVIEQVTATECRVVRLISSNPMHYLNTTFTPGSIIPTQPQLS